MMAPQMASQSPQASMNQIAPQNQYYTFSAAAAVAPIVLWSEHSQGNVYLSAKNTFLEFYTEENKAIKRHACARSASCDSSFKETGRSSTATPTNRSRSPTNSLGSSDGVEQSPNGSPRFNRHQQRAQLQHTTQGYDNYQNSYNTYKSGSDAAGYPMMMVPMMMGPVATPCANEPAQEVQPQPKVVKPPKKQDLKELPMEPVDEITTLMIRGIPCSFSQDTLMKLIDNCGLKGKYDFFYLPRAGNNGSNLGYAFVNFVDNPCAEHFMTTFNGVPLDPSRSMKICTISPGDIQGLANLRKHFRRTAVSRGSRGPVFLKIFSEEESQQ